VDHSREISHHSREISREISSTLDERLSAIQRSLLDTHQVVVSQSHSVKSILESINSHPQLQLESSGNQPLLPWHASGGFFKSVMSSPNSQSDHLVQHRLSWKPQTIAYSCSTDTQTDSGHSPPTSSPLVRTSTLPEPVAQIEQEQSSPISPSFSQPSILAHPAGPFETSPNFFPETYSIDLRFGNYRISVLNAYEERVSEISRTNFYSLSYLKSPRKLISFNLFFNVKRSSKYWDITKVKKKPKIDNSSNVFTMHFIPSSLIIRLEDFFLETEDLEDEACIELTHTEDSERLQIRIAAPDSERLREAHEALSLFDDLGCPRYSERQIIPIVLISEPHTFAAWLNGRVVEEIIFYSSAFCEVWIYNIQVLHCLSGASRINNFVGVIVDSSGYYLKGYMSGYLGPNFSTLKQRLSEDGHISWTRREKWARQIVEAVSQIHRGGFVAGCLYFSNAPIYINHLDQVKFKYFLQGMPINYPYRGYLPPESRHLRISKSPDRVSSIPVTPKIDLFHLGMVLWQLGTNNPPLGDWSFCKIANCALASYSCNKEHADPIGLPPIEDVPEYYREIVTLCRAKDPKARPPAWRLLEMFPPEIVSEPPKPEGFSNATSCIDIISPEMDLQESATSCDRCSNDNGLGSSFHCDTCYDGDYDICLACYDIGLHCLDPDHFLISIKYHKGYRVPGSYHSRVQDSGKREVIEC
jgi:hypothetical protein